MNKEKLNLGSILEFLSFYSNNSNLNQIIESIDSDSFMFRCKNGSKIHIKKNNRGKFTESANRAGMSVQLYASHVLANKDKYSSTLVKRANFARNASKWHKVSKHLDGNPIILRSDHEIPKPVIIEKEKVSFPTQNQSSEMQLVKTDTGYKYMPTTKGALSGADPIGLLVVEGAIFGKPFEYLGKGILKGIGILNSKISKSIGDEYTKRLLKLRGSTPSTQEGVTFIVQDFRDYLAKQGVDVSEFTDGDLWNFIQKRYLSITHPDQLHGLVSLMDGHSTISLRKGNKELGSIELKGNEVSMIERLSPIERGLGEELYNAAISTHPEGIISGRTLISPELTLKTWEKFKDKKIINYNGDHRYNFGRDVVKNGEEYVKKGPMVLLSSPSKTPPPVKDLYMFHPSMVTEDGKLLPPDWNDPNIYKSLLIPGIYGLYNFKE